MSEWAVCPSCNLRHTAREDGTCPRCKAAIGPTGGGDGPGWGNPGQAPGAYTAIVAAEPEGTWLGGCLAGFVFGLLGVIVAYFVGKPMTKQGAKTGLVIRIVLAIVVVVFALAVDPGAGPHGGITSGSSSWTTYTSPGGYSVELPGTPMPKDETVPSKDFGKMTVHVVQAKGSSSEAGHFDMPDGFNFIPMDVFDFMVGGMFVSPGTVLSTKPFPLGRNAGAEYLVELPKEKAFCKVRLAAVNRRIIYAFGCSKDRSSEVLTRVPASLRLN